MRRLATTALLVAVALTTLGCGDDTTPVQQTTGTPRGAPTTTTTGPRSTTALSTIALDTEVIGRFEFPVAHALDGAGRGYIAEKVGQVRRLDDGEVVLDIVDDVIDEGERGLLGLAIDPDDRYVYVNYSDRADDGATVIAEFPFQGGDIDDDAAREVLRIAQPYPNHNGGDLHFGPDGLLWIAVGDGGSGGDPEGHAQDTTDLLGSILRIDPRSQGGEPYGFPADNPFVAGGGEPEIWLYGVRNPWRFSFDPANGDLWIGDVGQNAYEEIDWLPTSRGRGEGANLGWARREGTHPYEGRSAPPGAIDPVFEYSHDDGCSVTGGVVYRGEAIPGLDGTYLFGDFCESTIRGIRLDGDGDVADQRAWELDVPGPISFGVDADGEVLVLGSDGTVVRITAG